MVLYYSGTGNSKYIAKCIASALETDCLNLNERIKAEDTSSVQTEENVILVTPTYAWRIPRIVSDSAYCFWLAWKSGIGWRKAHLVRDGLRQRDRQCSKVQPGACRTESPYLHGHGPNRYAGELYCFVPGTGQAGSKSDCRERKARYPKHH